MNEIDVSELFSLQKGLDEEIHHLHNESYESTYSKRVLALLVELGEFANETRAFKFWSLKGPSSKEVILDEWADALHFFLSIGIYLGVNEIKTAGVPKKDNIVDQLLLIYKEVATFHSVKDVSLYTEAFKDFLDLLTLLGYNEQDALEAYKKKLAVNYKRQENHY